MRDMKGDSPILLSIVVARLIHHRSGLFFFLFTDLKPWDVFLFCFFFSPVFLNFAHMSQPFVTGTQNNKPAAVIWISVNKLNLSSAKSRSDLLLWHMDECKSNRTRRVSQRVIFLQKRDDSDLLILSQVGTATLIGAAESLMGTGCLGRCCCSCCCCWTSASCFQPWGIPQKPRAPPTHAQTDTLTSTLPDIQGCNRITASQITPVPAATLPEQTHTEQVAYLQHCADAPPDRPVSDDITQPQRWDQMFCLHASCFLLFLHEIEHLYWWFSKNFTTLNP